MDAQQFLLFPEGAEDINVKVLQLIRHEHMKVIERWNLLGIFALFKYYLNPV